MVIYFFVVAGGPKVDDEEEEPGPPEPFEWTEDWTRRPEDPFIPADQSWITEQNSLWKILTYFDILWDMLKIFEQFC